MTYEICEDTVLTFKEAMSVLRDVNSIDFNRYMGGKWRSDNLLSKAFSNICSQAYNWDFTDANEEALKTAPFAYYDQDLNCYQFEEYFLKFIDFLFKEYGESYCVASTSMDDSDIVHFSIMFLDNILTRLLETWDKYNTIWLNLRVEMPDLMDAVKSGYIDAASTSMSNNSSGFSKFKDTPETAVTIENLGDDYNTNVSVNQGSTSGSTTTNVSHESSDERDTKVARLKEIEDKLSSIYTIWSKEFAQFFWEV